jgi:hypothetical protein
LDDSKRRLQTLSGLLIRWTNCDGLPLSAGRFYLRSIMGKRELTAPLGSEPQSCNQGAAHRRNEKSKWSFGRPGLAANQ